MPNFNDQEKFEFEMLRLIYEKTCEHHKYFLSWRQVLLAGYFTIVGIIFYSIYTLVEGGDLILCVIAAGLGIIIYFLSGLFTQLDGRNSELYRICQIVGENIEKKILSIDNINNKNDNALFNSLSNSFQKSKYKTHSEIIEIIYKWVGRLGMISSILVIIKYLHSSFYS
jgi:hypothetical protein